MSESIFATMKDLTYQGRVVVASVHCPSSETVHSFSHLILLTCDGRLAYHGPGDKALAHFARLGCGHSPTKPVLSPHRACSMKER